MGPSGNRVYVGNIPFDVTEEQLVEIFSEAGPVVSFNLIMDRDLGRSKGFGFCEYADPELAKSAVRNLNNYELNGRRLRVDYSDDAAGQEPGKPSSQMMDDRRPGPGAYYGAAPQSAPQTQMATDAITALLSTKTSAELFGLMTQMKLLVSTNPEEARDLLTKHPQFCYALFQIMIIMKAISPVVVQQVLQNALQQSGAVDTTAYPPAGVPAQPQPHQHTAMPGLPGGAIDMKTLPDAQKAALSQIMQMSEAQVQSLPPDQRQQIMQIRAHLANRPF